MEAFACNPRPGEVYNLGGGRENSVSMLEAMAMISGLTGRPFPYRYDEQARVGDHICYISDLRKLRSHFPDWDISISLKVIIEQMVKAEEALMREEA
jgi:CDP-paratose 2-epimerase